MLHTAEKTDSACGNRAKHLLCISKALPYPQVYCTVFLCATVFDSAKMGDYGTTGDGMLRGRVPSGRALQVMVSQLTTVSSTALERLGDSDATAGALKVLNSPVFEPGSLRAPGTCPRSRLYRGPAVALPAQLPS